MDFVLSSDYQEDQAFYRSFAERELRPYVRQMDQEEATALVGRGGLDREDPEDDAGEWRRRETGWMDWTRVWTKYIH